MGDGRAERGAGRPALIAWALYDWANSGFPTVIVTFVFPVYFARAVVGDANQGAALWGNAMSLAGVAIALLSPVLGAIADQGGRRKPWLAAATAACVLLTALLWLVRPQPDLLWPALLLAGAATVAAEIGNVFYNAMLPELAPPARLGRWSGWGWATGYAGGLACLVASLGLVLPSPPPFGLDAAAAEPVRATALLVAGWFALFAVPLFLLVPDRGRGALSSGQAVRAGLASLWRTVTRLGRHRNAAIFLVAQLFYTDALNTIFAFGGLYAAGTYGMSQQQVLVFGILLNVTAGLGCVGLAWLDDRIGSKRTVQIALVALILLGGGVVLARSFGLFYGLGLALGLFVGPVQSSSRALMARLSPPGMRAEFFGLYAVTGKITAFLGPALYAWATAAHGSQRAGMATILVLLVIGLAGLAFVRTRP
ncbi:MAG: MFS transporter [Dongiaceae bacterium]